MSATFAMWQLNSKLVGAQLVTVTDTLSSVPALKADTLAIDPLSPRGRLPFDGGHWT